MASSAGAISLCANAGMALNKASVKAEPRTSRLVFFIIYFPGLLSSVR